MAPREHHETPLPLSGRLRLTDRHLADFRESLREIAPNDDWSEEELRTMAERLIRFMLFASGVDIYR